MSARGPNLQPIAGCGPEGLLSDLLDNAVRRHPDKVALVADGRRWTYAQLGAAVDRLAATLLSPDGAALAVGARVGVQLDNSAEAAIAIFAALAAGGAFVPINPTTKPDKLAWLLADCAASALVLPARSRASTDALFDTAPSLRQIVTVGAGPAPPEAPADRTVTRLEPLFEGPAPDAPLPRRAIDVDLAAIVYTSGSTGTPKGVTLTHRNMLTAAAAITTYLENVTDDVILSALPLSFDYGLYQLLMSVRMGATLVLERGFAFPYRIAERIREEGVTGFPGVPTMFSMLLQLESLDPALLDSVRYLTNTGAALPPAHIERLRGLFRGARMYSMYGVTECKRVTYMPPDELAARPESVGRGMPNEEIYLVDDAGERLPPDSEGELVVRGSNVMQGYWGRPEETAAVLRSGPYPWERVLHTGDRFRMDADGYLYFLGRTDDIIKSRGEKVSPREVEAAIAELPTVRDVAVVGVADALLGQAIKAFVVPCEPGALTARDVQRHCSGRLESFMVPQHIEFRDALPQTDSGKVRHRALTEPASTGTAAPVEPLMAAAARTAAPGARFCRDCVLPDSYPGVRFDDEGVCNHCARHHRADPAKAAALREQLRARFRALADEVRERDGHHVLLAYSGGKDSTYTMWLLREVYDLRVLAVTIDNGFLSAESRGNGERAADLLGVDSLTVRPGLPLLRQLYAGVERDAPYPPKALERASALCNACIALVKNVTLRIALERRIPMIAYGWSPGQAPTRAALQRMRIPLQRQIHDTRTAPLLALAPEDMEPYTIPPALFDAAEQPPYSASPLAFHPYDVDDVQARLRTLGWQRPDDTDGNSSNCLLNGHAIRNHIARLGFHPYAFEVANHVREGGVSREHGLRSLADLGPEHVAAAVAQRLRGGKALR